MSLLPSPGRVALKTVTEYPLPADAQTHEMASPIDGLLLISQQSGNALVKMEVNPETGRPIAAVRHVLDNAYEGLHGLSLSHRYPGLVWATLQFSSELILIDPQGIDPNQPPVIVKRVPLPLPAKGPHGVVEDGNELWASCKDSHHVVRVNAEQPGDATAFPCGPRPIIVGVHPRSGDVYATLDQSSALFRVVRSPEGVKTETIPVPADIGSTPVGLVPGPDGNLWFVLLGNASGGQGRFGRLLQCGQIDWFQIKTGSAAGASLLHLGFLARDEVERIFLLGSSIASASALNAVFEVGMSGGYSKIESQQTIALPTQRCWAHRVLPTRHGVYVTELNTCTLAHLSPGFSPYGEGINEASDAYTLWGLGVQRQRVDY